MKPSLGATIGMGIIGTTYVGMLLISNIASKFPSCSDFSGSVTMSRLRPNLGHEVFIYNAKDKRIDLFHLKPFIGYERWYVDENIDAIVDTLYLTFNGDTITLNREEDLKANEDIFLKADYEMHSAIGRYMERAMEKDCSQ